MSEPAPTHGAKPDPPPSPRQDIINNEACEEMDPSSDSVHTGDRIPAAAASAQQQPGRTTPPTSLAIMPGKTVSKMTEMTASGMGENRPRRFGIILYGLVWQNL